MEFDQDGTPFIQFPAPHDNLRITPPLYSDGPAVAKINNDPRVYMYLSSPPFPYTQKSWDDWWPIVSKMSGEALAEFKKVQEGKRKWVGTGSPVTAIREMKSDGTSEFIGDIMIRRSVFLGTKDKTERKRAKDENEEFEAGDPRIQWEMGFYLSPEVHGRGIMPVALRLSMEKFFIPFMNAHCITGAFLENNAASKRVFEKNGFELVSLTPDAFEIAESKVGGKGKKVGIGMMKWERKVDS